MAFPVSNSTKSALPSATTIACPELKGLRSPNASEDTVALSGVSQISVDETCSTLQFAQAGGLYVLSCRPPNETQLPF
jgi:hypothetical protein